MDDWQVLIVEDETDSAEVVARILTFQNISHVVANNAEDALTLLESEVPTMVVIDLALPGMSGWELLRAMRDNPSTAHVPAVAVTAYHSTNVAQEAIKAGFDTYFPKPIEATTFVRELERIGSGG